MQGFTYLLSIHNHLNKTAMINPALHYVTKYHFAYQSWFSQMNVINWPNELPLGSQSVHIASASYMAPPCLNSGTALLLNWFPLDAISTSLPQHLYSICEKKKNNNHSFYVISSIMKITLRVSWVIVWKEPLHFPLCISPHIHNSYDHQDVNPNFLFLSN